MAQASGTSIPLRKFGRSDAQVSALGFGGHHLGEAPDEKTAIEIVHQAVDRGITFFDNCWEYRRGKTEIWMGGGLLGDGSRKQCDSFHFTRDLPGIARVPHRATAHNRIHLQEEPAFAQVAKLTSPLGGKKH
jgi:predicted aldo/keto reductase-like oxidoreductase